ncbi:MAG: NAD(P)/FAD-dependent oxidoreductase, partial [Pseudomonadota bacterium]
VPAWAVANHPQPMIAAEGVMADGQMQQDQGMDAVPSEVDVVIVGAGFAGMYLIKLLRERGLNVVALEAGTGVGGTWYWNRYPGARCDIESMQYSLQFDKEIEQEWDWSERYAPQPEILAYANHVADKHDIRRNVCFNTFVTDAEWDEATATWTLTTKGGDKVRAPYYIMATGCLSVPNSTRFPGEETFKGPKYRTGLWPHHDVRFDGMRVGVIGTGSSAIQSIPIIAEQAAELTVFQRTPNYSVPARNHDMDPAHRDAVKADYAGLRERQRMSFAAADFRGIPDTVAIKATEDERTAEYQSRWDEGGLGFMASYADLLFNPDSNLTAQNFVREKIRETVDDPATAELLCPSNTIGCKRLCVDTNYYATYNLPHVSLVDISGSPIEKIDETSIHTGGTAYEVDAIVFAIGFDAMTGALLRVDIKGRDGISLRDHWKDGPKTYLGLTVAGFPNMFTVTGPGSPSVFTNMLPSIEHHCEWITRAITDMREGGHNAIEATPEAETDWTAYNLEVAGAHLRSSCSSWYTGENIAGKPKVFMPFIGGFAHYVDTAEAIAADDYRGFEVA